jgi:steroid delta-isomerase-like uncharacterized protein
MDNVEIAKRQLDMYSAGKWDEYRNQLADNVRYEELSTRTSVSGRDKYIESVKRWKTAFPDVTAKVLNSFSSGDSVILEVEWTGTQTGPMEGPLGTIQATNKKGSVRAVLISKFQNGKIIETRHYFDLMTVLAQTGVLAGMGAQQPKTGAETRPSAH